MADAALAFAHVSLVEGLLRRATSRISARERGLSGEKAVTSVISRVCWYLVEGDLGAYE